MRGILYLYNMLNRNKVRGFCIRLYSSILVLFLSTCPTHTYSQDTIVQKPEVVWRVKGSLLPIIYGITFGYTYYLGTGIKWKRNEINLGYKYLNLTGYPDKGENNVLIFEYKRFFYHNQYLSPYLKYRKLHLSDYDDNGKMYYDENSIGVGITIGEYLELGKKKRFFVNGFIGGGIFLPINSFGYSISGYRSIYDYNYTPSPLLHSIDFRVGVHFGINIPIKKI